ncbi:winged helix-turn-helix transcriptional regulator, partial [Kitasatospora sp. NPDC058190]|uniref:winged helix-turn-helix transcriptional regulator n=1 Tax=Kitasatospora sp. NPDC058190 TaxID=3346371 RepID=UPI0036DB1BC4
MARRRTAPGHQGGPRAFKEGAHRYGALRRLMPQVSEKVLVQRLRRRRRLRLTDTDPHPGGPPCPPGPPRSVHRPPAPPREAPPCAATEPPPGAPYPGGG